ncbi:hypothetical protein DPEC_G00150790 [Dallia pectoralis]|uniref:Uncharacterized protein n=1 Tax=Dallia pectoralis TaxID=75939 RepID=A0ACC2GJH7_DALPE|nr:hypothetical protein DPEC_G00150790 [Dallia pectoralis]
MHAPHLVQRDESFFLRSDLRALLLRALLLATPHPGGFKCFTCKDAPDNYECNRWAPDIYCPRDSRYCYTFHEMDTQGGSVSVTKRCVAQDGCRSIGCIDDNREGYKVCTACCEGNICKRTNQMAAANAHVYTGVDY